MCLRTMNEVYETYLRNTDDDIQDEEATLDSPQINVIQKPPPPTHYSSVTVAAVQPLEAVPD